MELLHEGETSQKCLKDMQLKREIRMVSKKFTALMKKGNVNAAINLLLKSMRNGILPLNVFILKTIYFILQNMFRSLHTSSSVVQIKSTVNI